MAQSSQNQELIDRFGRFYRNYYRDEISRLAQRYPGEQRSLHVDYDDLYQFDPDLAEDFLAQPDQIGEFAEEALRVYDLPADVSLGQAHVRLRNLPDTVDIRSIRVHDNHVGRLIAVSGIIRKATDVRPKIVEAAFECQRCGTMTYIPQTEGGFQEPHECQGCERQGPFRVNYDQSEFVDSQKLRVQESPEGLRGGETPQSIDIDIEDDITGEVTAGDHVTVTGVLHIDQVTEGNEKSQLFDLYMDGVSVEIEDEQFEDMEITEADKKDIVELSSHPDIYEEMVASVAPSIYGYDEEKLAMILQLFSGVTKDLPDGSRIRGDLHMLLIGDPGTGKCQKYDTDVVLGDGTERKLGDVVESRLDNPISVDDGVYQPVDFPVQSVTSDGRITVERATKVWKREAPDRMYRIQTESGREVEVTPSHPLFVQDGLEPSARIASDLTEGTFVALPRCLRGECDDSLDIDHRRVEQGPANRLDTPETLTPELARLLGYQIGEGHVNGPGSSSTAAITNTDDAVIDDVSECLDSLGLRSWRRQHQDRNGAEIVGCSSVEYVDFLREIEPAILERSAEQRVPDCLFRATPEIKRAFLKAYIEGEGHVSRKEREITVASMSEELLEGVRNLLLSLGIETALEGRQNGSYRLRISGTDFVRYVREVGFVTDRKATASMEFVDTPENTNTDIVPGLSDDLRRIREALGLSQFDCGVPRTTYQHYERGDRNPSRGSLREVLRAFGARLDWLQRVRTRFEDGDWGDIEHVRRELNVSQAELADAVEVSQRSISNYERGAVTPDGGITQQAQTVLLDRIEDALAVADDVRRLWTLVDNDITWDRIESIEPVDPEYDWVYDLEVAGTHTYLGNGVVSHNSQLLSYIRNIAPRSVYTSGKGSSSAGLCVTGDTLIHTADGFEPIRDLAEPSHPDPVDVETSHRADHDLYTFDRVDGEIGLRSSSHVWRMPEKPCRRIETSHGKELETSVNTPVLVCGDDGIEWREIRAIEAGDFVAVPKYDDIERTSPPPRTFFEFTEEKLKPTDESVDFLRRRLREEFGTLRDAASELGLSEDFIYDSVSNRHLPLSRLDRILDGIDADRSDIDVSRAMLGHGNSVEIPDAFDADLMYLVGLVFGDGDIMVSRRGGNRGHVRVSNADEELLRRAARIAEEKFDKSVDIEHRDERVPCLRIHSATLARFFRNLGMESPKDDLALDPRLTTADHSDAFLRGLFDADGSVCARDDGGSSVQFSTISDDLGRQVQLMLETYGVRSRRRERDRRGTYELASGYEIESKAIQTHLAIYGRHIDDFADRIGFASSSKTTALERIVGDANRRGERIPVGGALAAATGPAGAYYQNIHRGDNPERKRARAMLEDRDLGPVEPIVREAVGADLVWDEVVAAVDTGEKELFDLTVPGTNNFVGNGVVTHNTAAAVRDDFGEGQQWSLEAGALVLADQGIAAVDELDKMRCVTGDTLVHLADGTVQRIEELARDAAATGTIEELDNGRTIRDVDVDAWTMTDDGRIVSRPVTAIHEYEAPETLTEVRLETGERLTSTADHPFFVFEDGERVERAASNLSSGDLVYVPRTVPQSATDGGVSMFDAKANTASVATDELPSEDGGEDDVILRRVASVEAVGARGHDSVYDLTVDGTHNFVANGMVVHNSEDRSAMHQALEQQEISISKAGINATLKSRCSLLGAANPKYGRFDQYEPIGEQIDLEPALISRFDLIFTVTDQPDPEEDAALADHILRTNYAGELNTQRAEVSNPNHDQAEVAEVTDTVEPAIDPDLLRKYIAYAKRTCYPTMSDEAKAAIREFYVDLRAKGADEDAPVPVTARKLEALVRLAEASARVRLSDTVERADADRVIDIVRSCLQDIGVDPETGEFDADVIETGTSKSQRDRIKSIKDVIETVDAEYEGEAGAPIDAIVERAEAEGIEEEKVMDQIEQLRRKGDLYSPKQDQYKVV